MKLNLIDYKKTFDSEKLENIEETIDQEFGKSFKCKGSKKKIAVAVGSRGIANISTIVKRVIDNIKSIGHEPFIVPAMGSHGGATADGQIEVLQSYGITENAMGVPIKSSMEVVKIKADNLPCAVYIDKFAYESDGVVLVNRVKAHTDFNGRYESGLVKMSVIGLGKHKGALEVHGFGSEGLKNIMPLVGNEIIKSGKIIMGLAIVENAYDETFIIEGVKAARIMEREPELLEISKKNMPYLPIKDIDLLIVDQMGKNISGTGLDPNVTGRLLIRGEKDFDYPHVRFIIIGDITEESHGNAMGVGFADVITKKLYDKIDFKATYANIITSTFLERGKIPIIADDLESAFNIIHRSLGSGPIDELKIIQIKDTLHLSDIKVSKAVLDQLES